MEATVVRHPCPLPDGTISLSDLNLLWQKIQPRLDGIQAIISTGLLRTDQPGTFLHQQTGLPHFIMPTLGSIRLFPVLSVSGGGLFYSALSSSVITNAVFKLWTTGVLLVAEPPKKYTRRIEQALRQLEQLLALNQLSGPIVVLGHRELFAALQDICGKRSLADAIQEEVPHLHMVVFEI